MKCWGLVVEPVMTRAVGRGRGVNSWPSAARRPFDVAYHLSKIEMTYGKGQACTRQVATPGWRCRSRAVSVIDESLLMLSSSRQNSGYIPSSSFLDVVALDLLKRHSCGPLVRT
jgi:hypothetical protein